MTLRHFAAAAPLLAGLLAVGCGRDPAATVAPAGARYEVEVRRTALGIPHIRANDFASLGYGYGYAHAEDNLCVLQEDLITIRGERAKYFGRAGEHFIVPNASRADNVSSDFFWKFMATDAAWQRLKAVADPALAQVTQGFVDGYNRYIAELRAGGHNGRHAACRDEAWLTPITEADMYRRYYRLALIASSSVFVDAIAELQPPTGGSGGAHPGAAARQRAGVLPAGEPRQVRQQHVRAGQGRGRRRATVHGVRQPALPVERARAPLHQPPDRAGADGHHGRVALRRAGGADRLHRRLRVEPHRVHGLPLHDLRADAGAGQPDAVRLRRPGPRHDRGAAVGRGEGRGRAGAPHAVSQPLRADDDDHHRRPAHPAVDHGEGLHHARRQRRERPAAEPVRALEPGEVAGRVRVAAQDRAGHSLGQHRGLGPGRPGVLRRHQRGAARDQRQAAVLRRAAGAQRGAGGGGGPAGAGRLALRLRVGRRHRQPRRRRRDGARQGHVRPGQPAEARARRLGAQLQRQLLAQQPATGADRLRRHHRRLQRPAAGRRALRAHPAHAPVHPARAAPPRPSISTPTATRASR
jgi:hypothetical protein